MPNSVRQHLGIAGLFTDPNLSVAVPEGALSEASEIVIRRVGVAEPRPGFADNGTGCTIENLYALIPFGTSASGAHVSVGAETTEGGPIVNTRYASSDTTILDEDSNYLQWNVDHIRGLQVRGNLYLTTEDKPRKYDQPSNAVAFGTGLVPPSLYAYPLTSGSGTAIATGYRCSLRALIRRTDENGVITYSAPTGRVIIKNDSGATRDIEYRCKWEHAQSGDIIQLYKSAATTSDTPEDVHFLVYEYEVGATYGTTGTLTDTTTDDNLGEALYTNDDATQANWRPPACYDLALYAGSMFYIGSSDYARVTLSWKENPWTDLAGQASGIGYRSYIASHVNGSNLLTGLSSITGLKVGMLLLNCTSWTGTGPVRITSMGGTSVTLSEGFSGSSGSYGVVFYDSIKIGSDYFPAASAAELIECVLRGSASARFRCTASASFFAVGLGSLGTYIADDDWLEGPREVVFECVNALDALDVAATHGDEYTPSTIEPASGSDTYEPDENRAMLWYSKQYEPEHRLLASFQEIGNDSPILRGFATRDALWLLKGRGDGIYRLSGAGATAGFRVDQIDSSTYLLHPNLAVAFEDRVYAWTNRGLVSISDEGVIPISDPMIGSDLRGIQALLSHTDEFPGAFAVACPKTGEVIFGLPPDNSASWNYCASRVYVFNTRTKALTEWFKDQQEYTCAVYLPTQGKLALGMYDTSTPRLERIASEGIVAADRRYTGITISVVDGTEVEFTGGASAEGTAWVPAVGDLVFKTSYFVITEIVSSTQFVVHQTGMTTGAAVAYEAFEARLAWVNKVGEGPAGLKKYTELTTHFDSVYGLYGWDVEITSATNYASTSTLSYTRTHSRTELPYDHRALVPRTHAVTSRLYPKLSIRNADARFRISGISLGHEPISSRVSR